MKNLLHFVFLLFSGFTTLAQSVGFQQVDEKLSSGRVDTVKKNWSVKKELVPDVQAQALLALSYYPELENIKIKFKRKTIATTMACRPTLLSSFLPAKQRKYIVYINIKNTKRRKVLLDEVPFDAQVGLIGHELGHVVDYLSKDFFSILSTGIKYTFSKKYRQELEHQVDKIAISHGLGWQIYRFSDYVLNQSKADESYKRYKRTVYYSPDELRMLILRLPKLYSAK